MNFGLFFFIIFIIFIYFKFVNLRVFYFEVLLTFVKLQTYLDRKIFKIFVFNSLQPYYRYVVFSNLFFFLSNYPFYFASNRLYFFYFNSRTSSVSFSSINNNFFFVYFTFFLLFFNKNFYIFNFSNKYIFLYLGGGG